MSMRGQDLSLIRCSLRENKHDGTALAASWKISLAKSGLWTLDSGLWNGLDWIGVDLTFVFFFFVSCFSFLVGVGGGGRLVFSF